MGKSKRYGFALPAVLGVLALTSLACATVWRMQWVNQQLLNVQFHQIRNQQITEGVLALVVTDAQTHALYPATAQDRDKLQLRLGTAMCQAGICAPKTLANLNAEQWRNLLGQSQQVNVSDLPIKDITAFYWVEVWLNAGASQSVQPSPFIYRITVLVQQTLPTSASELTKPQPHTLVMQAIWSRATETSPSIQWHSWKLLA
ncbi:MAG: hypothetical protein WCL41_03430 [Betaproteobacteria bacterium]